MTRRAVFSDRELVELLGDKSDLLAIADAIASVGAPASRDGHDGDGTAPADTPDSQPIGGGAGRWLLRRPVLALVAAVFAVVVLAAPAFAVSPWMRELVGFGGSRNARHEFIVAKVTAVTVHLPAPRFAPPLATVTFTVGQEGEAPGAGIPSGSVLFVSFLGRDGDEGPLIKAFGTHGRYRVTLRTPDGGISDILVGGFLNSTKGTPAANGTFWIPVIDNYLPEQAE